MLRNTRTTIADERQEVAKIILLGMFKIHYFELYKSIITLILIH